MGIFFLNVMDKISEWFFSSYQEELAVTTFLKIGGVVLVVLGILFVIFIKVLNARDKF